MYDGPGLRTIVFFKGCPLRCQWCSNPESQERVLQVLYKREQCVRCGTCAAVCPKDVFNLASPNGHIVNPDAECIGCGRCVENCPGNALAVVGEMKPISELMRVVEEDRPFYDTSGGGLTLGGGEALMQPRAAISLLMACRQANINTAIETSGYARPKVLMSVAEFVDLFLYDIKHMNSDKHHQFTGVRNECILSNLKLLLDNRYNVRVRLPLLKGINDDETEMRELVQFLTPYVGHKNFKGIDLLPYHKLGVHKYAQLGREYLISGDVALGASDLERLEQSLKQHNLPVAVIKH
jgi:pyruvate formate lyase activating enzyme